MESLGLDNSWCVLCIVGYYTTSEASSHWMPTQWATGIIPYPHLGQPKMSPGTGQYYWRQNSFPFPLRTTAVMYTRALKKCTSLTSCFSFKWVTFTQLQRKVHQDLTDSHQIYKACGFHLEIVQSHCFQRSLRAPPSWAGLGISIHIHNLNCS